MPKRKVMLKREGEKLLKLEITFDQTIHDVHLHGDFFVHPEEGIKHLEESLKSIGIKHSDTQATILRNIVVEKKLELLGISVEGIVEAIKNAYEMENN